MLLSVSVYWVDMQTHAFMDGSNKRRGKQNPGYISVPYSDLLEFYMAVGTCAALPPNERPPMSISELAHVRKDGLFNMFVDLDTKNTVELTNNAIALIVGVIVAAFRSCYAPTVPPEVFQVCLSVCPSIVVDVSFLCPPVIDCLLR